jgi:Na+-transporting NADH:ubiquinone oxidoreductase subunit D
MSATTESQVIKKRSDQQKRSSALFSKKEIKLLSDPLNENNPITVQVLGICSALAVTTQVWPSFILAIAVIFVMIFSSLITSLIRHLIPPRVRIIVMLTIISSMVVLVDQVLKAFLWDVSRQLSVFVGLIITNCIIMGRLEAFASSNKPWPSVIDAFGNALGYGAILLMVAIAREVLGSGEFLGIPAIPAFMYDIGYVNNGLMVFPAGALFTVGIIIWIQRSMNKQYEDVN